MTDVGKFNNQSVGEEIANAISHGIGALLASAGTAIMLVSACLRGDAISIVSAALYGFSLIVLYTFSTLYHSVTNIQAKKVLQVFDHCSIFILIWGTYVPMCLAMMRSPLGWTVFGVITATMVVGIVLNAIDVKRFHKLSLVMYLVMSWAILVIIKYIFAASSPMGLVLLFGGGLAYTGGVFFYKAEKPRFMHPIWHLFVLAGSILHYFFILFYAL